MMDPEDRRLLRETHADVAIIGKGLVALIQTLKKMEAMQSEALRQILEAVTAPIPESKVPARLDQIIALIEDEAVVVDRIDARIGVMSNG